VFGELSLCFVWRGLQRIRPRGFPHSSSVRFQRTIRAEAAAAEYGVARIFRSTSIDRTERAAPEGRMPHRQFTDSKQTTWEVWDVEPGHAERRTRAADGRKPKRPAAERRHTEDRARVRITSGLAHGWLAFESKHDRRRLAPIPADWDALDESALERLCELARPVGKPRRLLD
jgi:hypothetical protein